MRIAKLLFLLVAACGGSSSKSSSSTTPAPVKASEQPGLAAEGTYPVPTLAGVVQCWSGTGVAETANGGSVNIQSMYRRAWDAASATVQEDAVTYQPGQAAVRQLSTQKVTGQTAVVSGEYNGTSELVGEAGAWTGWTTTLKVPAGKQTMTAKTTAAITDGKLHQVSAVMDGTNTQILQYTFDLLPLDEAGCKAAFSRVPPKS